MEFHKWARKNNWRNPTDPKNGALKEAYGTDLDVFQYLHSVGCLQEVNNHSGFPVSWTIKSDNTESANTSTSAWIPAGPDTLDGPIHLSGPRELDSRC